MSEAAAKSAVMAKAVLDAVSAMCTKAIGVALTPIQSALSEISKRVDSLAMSLENVPTTAGEQGPKGDAGERGADGKNVTVEEVLAAMNARLQTWMVEHERSLRDTHLRWLEMLPKPKDGVDGLGFDDLAVEQKGQRIVAIRFSRGEQVKEFSISLPALVYREIYKRGEQYAPGDIVTWGGHMWHCDAKNDGRIDPGKDGAPWTQCVKRGGDGASAYHSAVKHGFVGSEREWVESIGKPTTAKTVRL